MNEYIVQGQSWLSTDSNLVLTSNTDALETGGLFIRIERDERVSNPMKLGNVDVSAATRVTIGGNFSVYDNVFYGAEYVSFAVQAIGFNTTGGSLYTAAHSGAISEKSKATDSNISVRITKSFNSEKSTGALLDSDTYAAYSGEASAVGAVGMFSVNGSLGGNFNFESINDYTQAWRVNSDGKFVSSYRENLETIISGIRVKQYISEDKKTLVQAQFVVENNITANFSGLVNGCIAAISLDESAAGINNNTVAAYGYYIQGGSTAGFSLFSVANGYMGGSITLIKEKEEEEGGDEGAGGDAGGGEPRPADAEPAAPGEGEGEEEEENPDKNWTVFRYNQINNQSTVALSNNRSGLYGVAAEKIAINRYTGVMTITNTKNKIEGVEGNVGDSSSTTISNNKFEAIGFDGAMFAITGEFAGELNVSTMENYIYFLEGGNYRYSSGNEISAYGIRLVGSSSGKEFQAGTLESSRNFRGTLNVENSISDMTPENKLSANQTTYTSKTYGIYAESSISITGGLSSTIVSNSFVVTNSNKYSVNVGIYASSLSAQYFGGDIKVSADWTTSGNGVKRCVGIYAAESLLNDNDKILDITGSITVAGGEINACVWGGRTTGIKIRLSGSLLAGDGKMGGVLDERYAVFAGTINEDNVYIRYATDDYVELAAGSSAIGDIELFNGDNAMVVDSNSSYFGSIYTTFGTLNLEFRLNDKMFRGDAKNGDVICKMVDDTTLLTSTTTITVNLDDAKEGETYVLVGGTLDLDRWAERQISVSYQGETYTTTIGGNAFGKYFQVSTNIDNGNIILTVDKLVANALSAVTIGKVEQDAKKDMVTLNWSASTDMAYYLVEYSLDGGNTIVVKVDGEEDSLDIKAIDIGTKVEWRVRGYSVNNRVSEWSSVQSFVVNVPSANIKNPDSTSYDSETGNAGSSVVYLDWKTPESSYGIECYEVQYYTTPDNVSPDWSSATVYTKKVTGTDVLVSGLTNLDYVFWRVRAIDVKGNVGEWAKGDTLRVYAGDTTAPEFDVKSVTAVVKFVESGIEETPIMMQVDLIWKPAVEIDGKSGVAGYQISYRLAGSDDVWTSVRFDGKATSGTIGLLKNGVYEWKMQAVDYAGNKTAEYPGIEWVGDYIAPTFKYGENLEAEITAGNRTNNILLTWNEASDGNDASSYQSGLKEYILYYKLMGADDSTAKKIEITDLSTSYELDSKTAKLADGDYVWWLEAYDNMDNVTKTATSTFKVDTSAPVGGRTLIDGPTFKVEWEDVITTSPLGVQFTESVVKSIAVTFTVNGQYTDANDIYYVMQCSNNSNFTGSVYEYKALYTGNTTTITFNDSFELGAGGLAKLGTVYFRMQTVDAIGNETGAWSYFGDSFKMVDPVTGKVITDTVAPTKVVTTNLLREDKQLTFSWSGATDAFGIKNYEISFNNKTTGKTERITGIDKLKYVTSSLAEGKYTWSVSAVDWFGQRSEWSAKEDFIVDVTAPVFDTTSLSVSVLNRDVCLTWSKATDNIEVAGYELLYYIWDSQLGGFSQGVVTKIAATENSFWFNNWADGRYSYQIRAFDTVGNNSAWSSTQYATVDTADDPGSTIAKAKDWFWGTSFSNIVGRTDTADYLRFSLDEAGTVTFSVDGVYAAENNNAGVTVTVYNASGTKIKSITLTPGKTGELSMLMGKGDCYVALTPNAGGDHNAVNYTVNGKVDYFPAASSNSSFATAETVKLDADGLGGFSGWVGYGDPSDYFKISASAAGTMQYLEFREVTSNLTVSIYDASGNQLKSYTVSANGKNYTSQLVPNGAYVVVSSGDGGKGNMNSSYSANIKLDYFPEPSGNGSFDTAAAITLDDKGSGKANGWVGYGDASDYYKVNLSHSATLDYISISGISSQVTVSLYDENRKLIKSVSTNKNGQLFNSMLLSGTFYVSVSSGDGGKGGMNTSYEITGGGAYMPEPTSNNSFSTAFTTTLDSTGKGTFGDWVGYGDPACYYHVVAERAGAVDISIAGLEGKVTVALYDNNRKLIKKVTTDSSKVLFADQLVTGSFYVSVTSGDNGKGKDNSGFTVTVEDDYFTAPSGNSSFATAQKVALVEGGVTQFTGWVGYGDPIDYFLVEATEAGSLNLAISGLASGATVTLYDEYYRVIKSVKASGDAKLFADQLVAGKFYVSVESGDKGKGKQNTNYTVSVEDRYFPANNGHNDFKNAQAVDFTVIDGKATAGVDGWVGYGDAADFYKFSPANAGKFSLSIGGLESGVKVAVYDANGKQIKSVSAKGSGVLFKDILISGAFYVSVTSGDNGKGKQNTDYTFDVVDDYFPNATDNNTFRTATAVAPSETGVFTAAGWVGYGDAADYYVVESASAGELELAISGVEAGLKIAIYDANGKQMKNVSVSASGKVVADLLVPGKFYISVISADNGKGKNNTGYELSGGISYFPAATDNNSFSTATAITGNKEGGWVGYGDAANFYVFNGDGAGMIENVTVSGLTDKVTVTVYNADRKVIKKVTTSSNGRLFSDLLFTDKFYVSIEAADKGKGKNNTYYELTGSGSYFPAATENNRLANATIVEIGEGAAAVNGWVGYGDAADFYKFVGTGAGTLEITGTGFESKATVTVYDANGKQMKKVSVGGNAGFSLSGLLTTGTFYVSIESGDKGKGKENTDYSIEINDKYFPAATANNTFAAASVVALEAGVGEISGWVGYGDAADYYLVSAGSSGQLDLSVSGLTGKATISVYDTNRKKLKNVSVNSDKLVIDNLLVNGSYYIVVESGDKGKENTDYTLKVEDSLFPEATANNNFKTALAVAVEDGKASTQGWVGYGDAADYYWFGTENSGALSVSLSGLEAGVSVAVYDSATKQMKKVAVKGDGTAVADLLTTGGVYVSVTSGDNGKGKSNTGYVLNVDYNAFPAPTANNSIAAATRIVVEDATAAVNGWVGYGDAADFYEFNLGDKSGKFAVNVAGMKKSVQIAIYDESGRKLDSMKAGNGEVAEFSDVLFTGKVYVSVTSGDNGKGKENTAYDLSVSADYFPAPSANSTFSTAEAINFNQSESRSVSGWVGYNDVADYYKIDMPFEADMTLTVSGLSAKAVIRFYDANYKAIGVQNITSGSWTQSGETDEGISYIVIESGDKGAGQQNTGYTMTVDSMFKVPVSENSTIETALELDLAAGSASADGTVGNENMSDFFKFDLAASGSVELKLNVSEKDRELGTDMTWALYDSNGNKQSLSDWQNIQSLEAGSYFAEVDMIDNRKWANYNISVTVK